LKLVSDGGYRITLWILRADYALRMTIWFGFVLFHFVVGEEKQVLRLRFTS
jgi:hypothetical protein